MAEKTPHRALAIGDHVRLMSRELNEHQSSRMTNVEVASFREPVEGLILSIRDIGTGKLVTRIDDDYDKYVIEMMYDQTFNAKFASLRNAPRGSDSPASTPLWKVIRTRLRAGVESGQIYTPATLHQLVDSKGNAMLDGWKVIKVWSTEIESLEQAETAGTSAG